MADGSVLIDTKLDTKGFEVGLKSLGSIASRGFSAITTGITAVSGALAAAGVASVKLGSDFEAGMSEVAAISGATTEQLDELTAKALEMGAKTKFSASDSADAFKYMAMAGWKTEDMLVGIEGIMNLAAAAGADLGVASDIVTDALTAMGYKAADAGKLANVMAAASSNANTNVEMMGETFKYAAPLLGALGYNMEDAAVAIGLMANAGIKGGQAGTSLRAILTRLANPTKQSATAMAALGISLTDAKGKMLPLSEIMDQMRESFKGLTQEEQAQYAAMLGGQEAMSGLLAIVNAAPEDYAKLTDAVAKSNEGIGAAAEMSAKMQDNLQGDFEQLTGAAETLGIAFYDYVVDPLRAATQAGTGLVESLNTALADGGLDGLVTAAGDVAAQVVLAVSEYVPTVVELATQLITSFMESVIDNAPAIGQAASNIGVTFVEGVLTILPTMLEAGISLITSLVSGLAQAAPELAAMAIVCVAQIVNTIITSGSQLVQAGGGLISSLISGISGSLGAIASSADQVINALYSGLTKGISKLGDAAKQLMTSLGGYLEKQLPIMIDAGLKMVVGLTGSIRDAAGKIVDGAIALAKSLAKGLADSLPTIIKNVPTIVSNIAGCINDNAPKILKAGIEIIGTLIKGIIQSIPTLVANIPKIIEAIVDVWEAFNWLNLGKKAIDLLGQGIKGMFSFVKSAGQGILDSIVGAIKNLPSTLANLGKSAMYSLSSTISGMGTAVKTAALQIFSAIETTFHTLPSNMLNIGKNIVRGLWNGISDMTGWIIGKLQSFGNSVLDGIKKFFGIRSPSRLMRDAVGINLGLGVAEGVIASGKDVKKALKTVATDASDAMFANQMKAVVVGEISSAGSAITGTTSDPVSNQSIDYDKMAKAIWKHAPDMNTYLDGEIMAEKIEPRVSEIQAEKVEDIKRKGG